MNEELEIAIMDLKSEYLNKSHGWSAEVKAQSWCRIHMLEQRLNPLPPEKHGKFRIHNFGYSYFLEDAESYYTKTFLKDNHERFFTPIVAASSG